MIRPHGGSADGIGVFHAESKRACGRRGRHLGNRATARPRRPRAGLQADHRRPRRRARVRDREVDRPWCNRLSRRSGGRCLDPRRPGRRAGHRSLGPGADLFAGDQRKRFRHRRRQQSSANQNHRLYRNGPHRAAAPQADIVYRAVRRSRQGETLSDVNHDYRRQCRSGRGDEEHGGGAGTDPGELSVARPGCGLAEVGGHCQGGDQPRHQCDDRAHAFAVSGNDERRHPRRVFPAGQSGHERRRSRTRWRHPSATLEICRGEERQ